MRLKAVPRLVVSLIIPFIAAAIGSLATSPSIPSWYASLNRPAWTPPNWLFGPVWTTLYILMGIAFFLVWSKGWKKPNVRVASYLYFAQLALNALWSVLFFGLQSPLAGLAGILPLWVLIALTMWKFYGVDKRAAYLLIPYICWVTAATFLNYSILVLN
jgi:tryptophan-rich sensory protein